MDNFKTQQSREHTIKKKHREKIQEIEGQE